VHEYLAQGSTLLKPHRIPLPGSTCQVASRSFACITPASRLLTCPLLLQMTAALRLADGVLLVVDAAEGVMLGTEKAIKQALAEGLAITLLVNKVDRLILELKLPPTDAYFKLRHTIDEVNALITANAGGANVPLMSPTAGNVAFSAGLYGWSFTLQSFAQLYSDVCGGGFDPRWVAAG
jgi:U5 small nuclear ribonucleoprotein component